MSDRITVDGIDYVRAYPVAPKLCAHCGRVKPWWTPGRLIAALQSWVAAEGRVPTSEEFVKATPRAPARTQPLKVFGTWNRYVKAAGFAPVTRRWWADDEMLDCLVEWRVREGAWPSSWQWEQATGTRTKGDKKDRPSASAVRKRFGSWGASIEAAKNGERLRLQLPAAPLAEAVRGYLGANGSYSLVAELAGIDEALVRRLALDSKTYVRRDTAEALATAIDRPDVLALMDAA